MKTSTLLLAGALPPGLQKQLDKNNRLRPGLQKRLEPLPVGLDRRLPRLPEHWERVILARWYLGEIT